MQCVFHIVYCELSFHFNVHTWTTFLMTETTAVFLVPYTYLFPTVSNVSLDILTFCVDSCSLI